MPIITPGGFNGRYLMPGIPPFANYNPYDYDAELIGWYIPESIQHTGPAADRWVNISGTGSDYDWVYDSALITPIYNASGSINGYPSMTFGGDVGQYLEMVGGGLDIAQDVDGFTIALVYKPVYPSSGAGTIFWASDNGDGTIPRVSWSLIEDGYRVAQVSRTDGGGDYSFIQQETTPFAANKCWDIFRQDFTSANAIMFENGMVSRKTTTSSSAGNTSNTASTAVILGALPTGGFPVEMELCEMLLWRGRLNEAGVGATSRYFNGKYCYFNAANKNYYLYVGDSNVAGFAAEAGYDVPEDRRLPAQVESLLPVIPGVTNVHINFALAGLEITETLGYMEFTYAFSGLFYPDARNVYMILGSGGNDVLQGQNNNTIMLSFAQVVYTYQHLAQSIKVYPYTTLPFEPGAMNDQITELVGLQELYWQDFGWDGLPPANAAVIPPPSEDFFDAVHLDWDSNLPSEVGVGKVARVCVETIYPDAM